VNKTVKLVKVQILPTYVVENEDGVVTCEISSKEPLTVYAHEVSELNRVLNEIQTKVVTDVLAPKS
jgi:hypothetical protein